MTVEQLIKELDLKAFVVAEGEREIQGGYAGDLLSWVMGGANAGDAWVTIMTNINVIAVASLADVACVILSESVTPDEEMINVAKVKGINLLGSDKTTFALCGQIGTILK